MRSFISKLAVNILLGLSIFGFISPALAAADTTSSQNIALTPSSAQLSIDPDASSTGTFSVVNQGKDSFVFSVSTAPYYVKGEDYTPDFTLLPGKVDASKWVSLAGATTQTLASTKLANID